VNVKRPRPIWGPGPDQRGRLCGGCPWLARRLPDADPDDPAVRRAQSRDDAQETPGASTPSTSTSTHRPGAHPRRLHAGQRRLLGPCDHAMVQQGVSGNFVINAGVGDRARATTAPGRLSPAALSLLATTTAWRTSARPPPATSTRRPGTWSTRSRVGMAQRGPTRPAATAPTHIGVTPWDNRLILAAENSPTLDNSRVRFSDAGLPETYTANSYVDLIPGDNEEITGICTWRDKVFVFKQTKFFVFYGTSADSTGSRSSTTAPSRRGRARSDTSRCVAMDDAVYFSNTSGLFRTTGGPPEKVSGPVDPLFKHRHGQLLHEQLRHDEDRDPLAVSQGRCCSTLLAPLLRTPWCSTPSTTPWSYWNIAAPRAGVQAVVRHRPRLSVRGSRREDPQAGVGVHDRQRHRHPVALPDGLLRRRVPEQEKWLRSMMLSGTGTVNVKTAVNDAVTLSRRRRWRWAPAPLSARDAGAQAPAGATSRVDISATSGQWSLAPVDGHRGYPSRRSAGGMTVQIESALDNFSKDDPSG
jgi:hypothetical protein